MGVTLHAIAPQKESGLVKLLTDHEHLSERMKDLLKLACKHQNEKLNTTFSNSWSEWRPILKLIENFNLEHGIGIPLYHIEGMSYNDGYGIKDPEHCLKLVEYFKEYIARLKKRENDTISLVTEVWYFKGVTIDGKIVKTRVKDIETLAKLSEKFKDSTILVGEIEMDGVFYTCFHSTDIDNLERFVSFLETCNGFIVY